MTDVEKQSGEPQPQPSCCAPAAQQACCEPSEKESCCSPAATAQGGCGCR